MTPRCRNDVSKQWLDVHAHGLERSTRAANRPTGLRKLVVRLHGFMPDQVVIEAAGGYDVIALDALHEAGFAVVRVNPSQAHDFAKATGRTCFNAGRVRPSPSLRPRS